MTLRRVVLIRHGETADNVAGRFLGRSDPPLTARGMAGARAMATAVAGFGDALVVSSPARRAAQTAELLGTATPLHDAAFRELDFGAWEGLTPAEVAQSDPTNFAAFERGDIDGFPGGETVAGVAQRTLDALARHDAPRLVVITHATVIRVLVTALLGLPVARYRAVLGRPGHCSWTELEQHEGGWRLLTYSASIGEPPA